MRFLAIACVVLALAACHKAEQQQFAANETAAAADTSGIKGLHRDHEGQPVPGTQFNDSDGEQTSLAEFSGKPVLVNLWATWCAPCVKELPTLDRLSISPGAPKVVAISQDMGPHASVAAFLDSRKIANLEVYQDPKMGLSGALGAEVLPTSILYDAQGREVWRYVGDLDWTSPEAARLLAEAGARAKG
jgi:thiol-disulfide isomerase/thioredoxin